MSFNEDELKKIKRATSGWFKKWARLAVAEALSEFKPRVEAMKQLPESERREELKNLVNDATNARHRALNAGASSYGHPEWAAAAACESWLHELASGTKESIARVETLIDELQSGSKIGASPNKGDGLRRLTASSLHCRSVRSPSSAAHRQR